MLTSETAPLKNPLLVVSWPIAQVLPYQRNARKIPQSAIDKVAASIEAFGWRQPICVDIKGVILCGHTRWLAAKKLGHTHVPVHVAENLTPAQAKAYRLMDNRSHQESDWDFDKLGPEMLELKGLDFDLSLTGFGSISIRPKHSQGRWKREASVSDADGFRYKGPG